MFTTCRVQRVPVLQARLDVGELLEPALQRRVGAEYAVLLANAHDVQQVEACGAAKVDQRNAVARLADRDECGGKRSRVAGQARRSRISLQLPGREKTDARRDNGTQGR